MVAINPSGNYPRFFVWDLDGVLSAKRTFPKVKSRAQLEGQLDNLEEFQSFMTKKGIPSMVLTGRNLNVTDKIIPYIATDVSVFEHGCLIYDPATKQQYSIIDVDKQYEYLKFGKYALESVIDTAASRMEPLLQKYQADELVVMDNSQILTFESKPKGKSIMSDVYASLCKDYFSLELNQAIANGFVKTMFSDDGKYLDIMPKVGKPDGLAHVLGKVLDKYGIDQSYVWGAGDSMHSDGPFLEMLTDSTWIIPQNSDARLIARARERGNAYITDKPYFRGTMDLLKKVLGD